MKALVTLNSTFLNYIWWPFAPQWLDQLLRNETQVSTTKGCWDAVWKGVFLACGLRWAVALLSWPQWRAHSFTVEPEQSGALTKMSVHRAVESGCRIWQWLGVRKEQFPSLTCRLAPELSWVIGGALKSTQRCEPGKHQCLPPPESHTKLILSFPQSIIIAVVGEAMWVYDSTKLFV